MRFLTSRRRVLSRWALLWLAFPLGLGWSGAAEASPRLVPTILAQPSAESRQEAKKWFDEGAALYTQGDYQGAIDAWEKAYELSEEPLIFENMANAYERLGELAKAREHLALWREAAPAAEHPLLDKRLSNLDERIAEKARAESKKKAQDDPEKTPKKRRLPTGSSVSVPGVILTAVGVAAFGTGIIIGAVGAGDRPEESEVCGDFDGRSLCQASARDDIESSNTLSTVGDLVWITGAITGAVGVLLLITYDGANGPSTGRLIPVVTPTGATMMWESRF